jgi:hypothetical protein
MSTAIGDLVATMGMNINPLRSAVGAAGGMFQRVSSQAGAMVAKVRNSLSGLAGGLGLGGLGGLLAGGGMIYGLKRAVDLTTVQEQAEKKLEAVLRATGGTAGYSAKELAVYAAQLQKTTNFGDETTIAAMGVMASFRQIRGDVFKDAIAAAQDLSSVMGSDLQTAVKQIGKALNDPIQGLTALKRMGIAFTEEQQKQIINLAAQGDLLGAQRIILGELKTKFGGAAKAMADPMKQAMNALGDAGEKIGAVFKPIFSWLVGGVAAGISGALDWLKQFADQFAAVGRAISDLWSAVWSGISALTGSVFDVLGASAVNWSEIVRGALQTIAGFFGSLAFTVRNFSAISKIAMIDIVLTALEYFPSMEGPIQAVGATFLGTWAGIKAFFSSIVQNIIGGLREIWNFAKAVGAGIAAAWRALLAGNFTGIGSAFGDAFMREFTSQANVKAPNAFAEFSKAYKDAADRFNEQVNRSGGMKGYLEGQKKELLDEIAKSETAFEARRRKKQAEQAAPGKPGTAATPPPQKLPDIKAELPKVAEYGSEEAYKEILRLTGQTPDKDKYAEETARNTGRIADAVERQGTLGGDEAEWEIEG